ncbi:MAG: VTT domain-containing protein, partial [Anaerolineaceae bacterium]
ILGFILAAALSVLIILNRNKIQNLGVYGYPGIFIVSILANATIIMPVPGVLVTTTMAAVFNPFWVAVVAGTGAAVGELSGYLAGLSGQMVVERSARLTKVAEYMQKYGNWAILVLSFIPNPAFDLAGMTAGAMKMPIYRFFFWCWLGKVLKMLVFAYAGVSIVNWFS